MLSINNTFDASNFVDRAETREKRKLCRKTFSILVITSSSTLFAWKELNQNKSIVKETFFKVFKLFPREESLRFKKFVCKQKKIERKTSKQIVSAEKRENLWNFPSS